MPATLTESQLTVLSFVPAHRYRFHTCRNLLTYLAFTPEAVQVLDGLLDIGMIEVDEHGTPRRTAKGDEEVGR